MKVKEVKKIILKGTNKEIQEFVNNHFGNKRSANEIMSNLQTLKKLKGDILLLGIARMDHIETDYDHSKYLPSLLALTALLFGIYLKAFNVVWVLFIATLVALQIIFNMLKERRIRATAVYFRSLLIQINESKKHSNKV